MQGIDTNILVRYLVMDSPKQSKLAAHFMKARCTIDHPGFITLVVLVELVWVFETSYKYSKSDIANALEKLYRSAQLKIENENLAWQALEAYRTGFDFSDFLIAAQAQSYGCDTTYTLDKNAGKSELFTLLNDIH